VGTTKTSVSSVAADHYSANSEGDGLEVALCQIMNNPTTVDAQSPHAGKIFSQPPMPSAQQNNLSLEVAAVEVTQKPPIPVKPNALSRRKPHISQPKVIAKLAPRIGSLYV